MLDPGWRVGQGRIKQASSPNVGRHSAAFYLLVLDFSPFWFKDEHEDEEEDEADARDIRQKGLRCLISFLDAELEAA